MRNYSVYLIILEVPHGKFVRKFRRKVRREDILRATTGNESNDNTVTEVKFAKSRNPTSQNS